MSKENEENPLILPKEDKERHTLHTHPRVREGVPTLEQVIARAEATIGFRDVKWLTNWYNFMSLADWCDENGNPLRNWGFILGAYIKNRKRMDALRDPDVITGKKAKASSSKKPSNYRPTPKENLDNAF